MIRPLAKNLRRRIRRPILAARAKRRLGEAPALIVLTYHEIAQPGDGLWVFPTTGVTPWDLTSHLEWLSARFRFVSLQKGIDRIRSGTLDETVIAVTFDDAHRGLQIYARDILSRLNVPATIFASMRFVEQPDVSWLLKTQLLIEAHRESDLRKLFNLPHGDLIRTLRFAPRDVVFNKLDALDALYAESSIERASSYYLDRAFLKQQNGAPFDIGNHGYHHHRFTWLTPDQQRAEIEQNQRLIDAMAAGRRLFAVPFGTPVDWNADTLQAARECGVEFITACGGINQNDDNDVQIRRIGFDRVQAADFPNTFYSRLTRR